MQRHTPEQVITKLRQAEADLAQGLSIAQVCQRLGVSEQTFQRWRNQYGGLKADEAKRLGYRRPIGSHIGEQSGPTWVRGVSCRRWPLTTRFCPLLLPAGDRLVTLRGPGETESGSAGTQPDEG